MNGENIDGRLIITYCLDSSRGYGGIRSISTSSTNNTLATNPMNGISTDN